ncbi:Lytic transglycosylase, catalytic [Alkaliphilus metalliredigens QYMF]|uniref:Lytic transglycosylase, catalytic n=1 Tax=Alkaliphilus metalliredigens (strain QYMF) TaxID=293826 RepID=A6TL69_ALKMQ|nr:S-layer homology domain-containing protein [Alkaliphilus metalliredigens]ABR46937.1 Lytic transglycosylase, catalytic [Alkaliphilus metalliredigens QYMF]
MNKRMLSLFVMILLTVQWVTVGVQVNAANPSHEQIKEIIEEVALEKNIPAVILKAIADKESKFRQFTDSGAPFVSNGNTGIMQVNRVHHGTYDVQRLREDLRYNIEAGADILQSKWDWSVVPTIGDGDPNIVENWYFALWAYNSWDGRNNPNIHGSGVYQEELLQLVREKYNQPVTSIDWSLIPRSGTPSGGTQVATPEKHHYAVAEEKKEEKIFVVTRSGGNRSIFRDVADHQQEMYIESIVKEEIMSGVGQELFKPDDLITREQVAKVIVDALDLEVVDETMAVSKIVDWHEVSGWARDFMSIVYQLEIMTGYEDGTLRPSDFVTREQAAVILASGLNTNTMIMTAEPYEDQEKISPWAIDSINELKTLGILQRDNRLRPKDYITRAEFSKWIYYLLRYDSDALRLQ